MEYFNISVPAHSDDCAMFVDIVNQGIDSHLEAFTGLKHSFDNDSFITRLNMDFPIDEIPLLLRRLYETEIEEAEQWADNIAEIQYGIEVF